MPLLIVDRLTRSFGGLTAVDAGNFGPVAVAASLLLPDMAIQPTAGMHPFSYPGLWAVILLAASLPWCLSPYNLNIAVLAAPSGVVSAIVKRRQPRPLRVSPPQGIPGQPNAALAPMERGQSLPQRSSAGS